MRRAIVPNMKVQIKTRSNDVTEFIDLEADIFGKDRKMKVVVDLSRGGGSLCLRICPSSMLVDL
jgi:hypothetical protein